MKKPPKWLFCPNMTFEKLEKGYQEYLLRVVGYTCNHGDEGDRYKEGEPLSIDDPKAEKRIKDWIVEYLNPECLWVAKGFASAREVDADMFAIDCTPSFSLFVEWVKLVKWKAAVKNNWLEDPYDVKEFNEKLYGWPKSLHARE
jgi:hypothetical protein